MLQLKAKFILRIFRTLLICAFFGFEFIKFFAVCNFARKNQFIRHVSYILKIKITKDAVKNKNASLLILFSFRLVVYYYRVLCKGNTAAYALIRLQNCITKWSTNLRLHCFFSCVFALLLFFCFCLKLIVFFFIIIILLYFCALNIAFRCIF